jgi:hypothetical protein
MRFAAGEDRRGSSIFPLPEQAGRDGLEKLAFDRVVAPAASTQSLENPHRVLR